MKSDKQNVLVSPGSHSTEHHIRLQDGRKTLTYWCHVLLLCQEPFLTELEISQQYHTANITQCVDRNDELTNEC